MGRSLGSCGFVLRMALSQGLLDGRVPRYRVQLEVGPHAMLIASSILTKPADGKEPKPTRFEYKTENLNKRSKMRN